MIGEAALLAIDVPFPKGIHLRRVTSEPDVHALSAMQEGVFKGGFAEEMADALLRRPGFGDGMELWDGRGRRRDRQLRPPRAGARHGVGEIWCGGHPPGMAWPRDLPGAHGGTRTISACPWQEADPQRLGRRLAPDPPASRTREGLDNDEVPVARRGIGGREAPAASHAPASGMSPDGYPQAGQTRSQLVEGRDLRAQRRACSNRGSSRTAAKSSSLRASSRNRGNSSTDRRRWANVSSPVSPASVAKHA
jgi:hypothetical protein